MFTEHGAADADHLCVPRPARRERLERFAVELSRARGRAGLSRGDLAPAVGVTADTLRNFETARSVPDAARLHSMCRLLGLPDTQLLALLEPLDAARVTWGPSSGRALADARKRGGHTQPALAASAGVSRSCLARWEQGRVRPKREALKRVLTITRLDAALLSENTPCEQDGFHARLARWRRGTGTSQAELARHVGVARGTVSEWERGRNKPCSRSTAALLRVLGEDLPIVMGAPAPVADTSSGFAEHLRRWRGAQNLSRCVLAARLGVHVRSVSVWEAGGMPSPAQFPKLAMVLHIPAAQLSRLAVPDGSGPAIGVALRRRRLALGHTRTDAAAALGVERSTVRAWENGKNRPGTAVLERLIRYLAPGA